MKKSMIVIAGMMVVVAAQSALAHDHGHEHMDTHMQNPCSMDMHQQGDQIQTSDMFLVKKIIDGYTVSFHAMKAKEGMQHGGTHNVMVKVEKDGQAITDIAVNSKVKHPNGESESKMLMRMGDWFMAAYNLDHNGPHQLMVLFKTSDGRKHFGGVTYPNDISDNMKAE